MPVIALLLALLILLIVTPPAKADSPNDDTIAQLQHKMHLLETQLHEVQSELQSLREAQKADRDPPQLPIDATAPGADPVREDGSLFPRPQLALDRLTFGGYGEIHANFGRDDTPDVLDFHRLVLDLGYEFSDWIRFSAEIEVEHAFVSSDSGGELSVEQAFVEFLLSDSVNVRAGRILTPLGIINQKHEPPTFNGVERPAFAKYIIPTTWSSDGVGIFGRLCPSLTYEAYLVAGLDGSKFDAMSGIRDGRIKERPSLNDAALTGRLDLYPFAQRSVTHEQTLRLGVSGYWGGLNNANKGKDPGLDGSLHIYSGDVEYSISKLDLRGAVAWEKIDGAREIGSGTASDIFGWYLEAGYHFWPDAWKTGRLRQSDAVAFVRYDHVDTQYRMPAGVARDPAGTRTEWTLGVSFFLTPSFVLKADYQLRDDDTPSGLDDLFNLGVGWQF